MANDTTNVLVAVTGSVYADPTNAGTAPTDSSTGVNAAFKDLGYVSEDGVELQMPEAGDPEVIKAWQNGATVRIIRTAGDEVPTVSLTLIEVKPDVIKAIFPGTLTQAVAEGSYEIDSTDLPVTCRWVIDAIDGSELNRWYIPRGTAVPSGPIPLTSTGAISFEVTISCDRDSSLGYNIKHFSTALKTGA